jgi:hypothetical protein
MKVTLERVSRCPKWPREVVLAGSIWLALVVCAIAWNYFTRQNQSLCPLRRLTGVPCAACGSTRATLAMLHCNFVAAFAWNPMGAAVVALIALHFGLRVVAGRVVRVELSARQWRIAFICGVVLLLVNWVYVFFRLGWVKPGI